MRGTRRLATVLSVTVMGVVLAAGMAVAATIQGGDADNTITGTNVADTLYGGGGNDTISGLAGSDDVRGQDGDDTLAGNDADQSVAPGNDQVLGGYGNDELAGGSGADTLSGGPGTDSINAGPNEDVAEDTISGGDGPDVISTYTFPGDRDVVYCGMGDDWVVADSLDQVAGDCETVDRVQENEPNLDFGTYALKPEASSECSAGRGTLTVANDPETGERGVEITFEEEPASEIQPASVPAPENCVAKVDYNTVAPPEQGEVGPAGSAGTLTYEGQELPAAVVDEQPPVADSATPESSPPPEEAGAARPWRWQRYRVYFGTFDPIRIKVAQTYDRISWWHNGYNVAFDSKNKDCYSRTKPVRWPRSHWYVNWCYRPVGHWFDGNGYVRWIGTSVASNYYNCDFGNKQRCTYAYNKLWTYGNGWGFGTNRRVWDSYGEKWWALYPWTTAYHG